MICVELAARMRQKRKIYMSSLRKPERKSALGRPSLRCGSITTDLTEDE
jgi:hypothetical protein